MLLQKVSGRMKRKKEGKWGRRMGSIGIVFVVCMMIFIGMGLDKNLKITTYTVYSAKVKAPMKIALLTDLHSCKYGEGQMELIEEIAKENPDAVFLGGDIADDDMPHENTFTLLEAIGPVYPCYYVTGNHEIWSKDVVEIKNRIRDLGVTVLAGEKKELGIGEQTLSISGVDDKELGETIHANQLETAAKGIDPSLFSILLVHRPEQIERYKQYDYDLVLSGHAHGGQWRIPIINQGILAPDQGFFPQYAGGIYQHETLTHIVSTGLARESTRIPRIFNPPEIVMVNIVPKHELL